MQRKTKSRKKEPASKQGKNLILAVKWDKRENKHCGTFGRFEGRKCCSNLRWEIFIFKTKPTEIVSIHFFHGNQKNNEVLDLKGHCHGGFAVS